MNDQNVKELSHCKDFYFLLETGEKLLDAS